jgi:hypothetical protein
MITNFEVPSPECEGGGEGGVEVEVEVEAEAEVNTEELATLVVLVFEFESINVPGNISGVSKNRRVKRQSKYSGEDAYHQRK